MRFSGSCHWRLFWLDTEKAIQVGDTIPRFTAPDGRGETFDSASLNGHLVLIKFFRAHGVSSLTWAGWIRKETLLSWRGFFRHLPDFSTFSFWWRRLRHKDHQSQTLLGALADEFEDNGFHLAHSTEFCPDLLVQPGVLTKKRPSQVVKKGAQECEAEALKSLAAASIKAGGEKKSAKSQERAKKLFQHALNLCPHHPAVLNHYGEFLEKTGEDCI